MKKRQTGEKRKKQLQNVGLVFLLRKPDTSDQLYLFIHKELISRPSWFFFFFVILFSFQNHVHEMYAAASYIFKK